MWNEDRDRLDRDKPSWSEMDKRRDRSQYSSDGSDQRRSKKKNNAYAIGKYKAALEDLFSPEKKLSQDQRQQIQKIQETSDRGEFIQLADEYIQAHGLPSAWGDISNFLRHKNPDVLNQTIDHMETLFEDQTETRQGNFIKDLSLIEMTTRDRNLRKRVHKLIQELQTKMESSSELR